VTPDRQFAVHVLDGHPDDRGDAFPVPREALRFLGDVREAHLVTIRPQKVRGNHVHPHHDECLVITFEDCWRVAWKLQGEDGTEIRDFDGSGAVVVHVPAGTAHAVQNMGGHLLHLVSLSNRRSDEPRHDTERCVLLEW
jgi:quercetin dioxygenase-like cupin family protein